MKPLKLIFCLLPVASCFLPFLHSDRALGISQRCWEIRRSRQILQREGLDDRNLALLEQRYCRRTRTRSRQNSHCTHLTIMAQLAGAGAENSVLARMVAGEAQIACSQYAPQRRSGIWQYANGQMVKFGSQWHYPNGQNARTGQDWRYPNGEYARFGLIWKYPNGSQAKFGGMWYKPNGDRVDRNGLLSWGCTYVGAAQCDRHLQAMRSTHTDQNDAALVALAWRAYQQQR